MATLLIQHRISDYDTWRAAFDRFDEARTAAGVRAHRIRRPVDDERYVVIDLDFDDAAQAAGFLTFLRSVVWANPANSPALDGEPTARVLETTG